VKEETQTQSGLKLNKKTILTITGILVVILLFAGVLTQIVPRGEYQTNADGGIVADSYQPLGEEGKLPFWRVFAAPIQVFTSSDALTGAAILLFIILIGGTFLILEKSQVMAFIMASIVSKFAKKKYFLLCVMTLVCMMLGSVVGILEESITLVPLAAAIALALGWDSLTGLGLSLGAVAIGYAAATFNPFNVGLVQSMADLQLFSGLGYRLVVFAAFYAALTGFLFFHAKRVEKHPEKSISYEGDKALRTRFGTGVDDTLASRKDLARATRTFVLCVSGVLVCAALSFIAQMLPFLPSALRDVVGYLPMVGMAVLFTTGGLLAGGQAGLRGKQLGATFWHGVKTVAPIAPLIIIVMSITYLLREAKIIDTMLHAAYEAAKSLNPFMALLAIFALTVVLEFFIGSGSAKAFLIMPILLPLADMLFVSRQSLTVAFALGDGICNILYPTSGIIIIAIGLIDVSYTKFLRFAWKLFVLLFGLTVLLLWIAQKMNY
jgi:uncharacterized ion transporter superfamily protein YfcC